MPIYFLKNNSSKPKLKRLSSSNMGKIKLDNTLFEKFEIGGKSLKTDLNQAGDKSDNIFEETKKQANMPINTVSSFEGLKEKISNLPVWGKVALGLTVVIGAGLLLKGRK